MEQVGIEGLEARLTRIDREIGARELLLKDRRQMLDNLRREYAFLQSETSVLTRVDQVLLAVSGKVLGQSTSTIDKLVTAGLRLTFDDQNLEFKAKVNRYRGKTSVDFELLKDSQSSPIMESYGGGVLVVAGVLLRVVVIIMLKLRRQLWLDESLSHLSRQYIPNASKLLKKLCEELDFTICMVSHDPEFADSADRHYEAYFEGGETKMRLVRAQTKPVE